MSTSEPIVYLNGEFVPYRHAQLSIVDYAVLMGATVTDQLRTFGHRPFRLDEHLERFYSSCKYARIVPPHTLAETRQAVATLVEHNAALVPPEADLGVVLFVSPGERPGYAAWKQDEVRSSPTFCIHSFPLQFSNWKDFVEKGVHVVTPPTRHVPPQCLESKIKHRSRLHWWIAEQEAHTVDPTAVPLLLDLQGNVTETAGANFLIVKDNTVQSPLPRNILKGVSLVTVMELCHSLGLKFVERDLQLFEVTEAKEALVTTTPYCLAPVTRINGLPIGDAEPGPIFSRLIQAWSELVGVDILQQIHGVDS